MKTPVLFIIFNRPEITKKVFQSIRLAKPSKLYVAADGPREDKLDEDIRCNETRSIIKSIDWPCDVYTLFQDKNLGCHVAVPLAIKWFFEQNESGIILEDDCLADISFFGFCEFLLDKYKYNDEVMLISGDNFFQSKTVPEPSYFFSKYSNIWGWATWRRSWEKYLYDFKKLDDHRMRKEIKSSYSNKEQRRYWFRYYKNIKKEKNINWDAKWFLSIIYFSGKCINPTVNLVKNIGFGDGATHTKDSAYLSIESSGLSKFISPKNENINYKYDKEIFKLIYKITIKMRLIQIFNIIFRKTV